MSKTDHPRIHGTHRVGHTERAWRKDDGESLAQRAIATRTAIEEGLTEYLSAPIDLGETYVRECDFDYFVDEYVPPAQDDEPVAEWEWDLLDGRVDGTQHATYAEYLAEHERKAREPRLAWSSDANEAEVQAWEEREAAEQAARRAERGLDDEDEDLLLGYECWLAPVTTAELFDLFPDGGFVVEGPTVYVPSGKADAHLRVYELAREVGIDSRHMVEYLRIFGEWVESHTSYVALPVCERVLDLADDLIAEYGLRTTPKTWAQEMAAWERRSA